MFLKTSFFFLTLYPLLLNYKVYGECCRRKEWFSCYGKDSCNIFCCNCKECMSDKEIIFDKLKNIDEDIIRINKKDKCNAKCNFSRQPTIHALNWFYNSKIKKCVRISICNSINSFITEEDCNKTCLN